MAAPVEVTTYTAAANAYAIAVAANPNDAGLGASLAALPSLCASAIAAIRATASPAIVNSVAACEVLLASCQSLGDDAASASPLIAYVVPEPMPVGALASRVYGAQASQHLDEILALNPWIGAFVVIPAGAVLRLAQAT